MAASEIIHSDSSGKGPFLRKAREIWRGPHNEGGSSNSSNKVNSSNFDSWY